MPDLEFSPVDADEMFASASKAYVPAPVNKMLKFHVVEIEKTEQLGKYEKNPDGSANPNYGKPQPVRIFKAMLDESAAKGQVYSRWITGYYDKDDKSKPVFSFGPKSVFGPIAEALAGSVDNFLKLKAGDLIGLPFQCALEANKKDPEKQLLNTSKIMPPSEDQVRVDVPIADSVLNEAEEAALAAAGLT